MNDSPYIFPELTATRNGTPDPAIEVDCWLSRLQEVLDTGPETADEAYDLLALWAKLRRVRPELLEELNARETLTRAEEVLGLRGADLASQALTIPNPHLWQIATNGLDQAFEDAGLAEARSTLAEQLLTDLDDATLALYAAGRHGIDDRELASELTPCLDWLAANAELFLPAAVHIQAVGMALRPDLPQFDYDLAVTALKYLDILCAIKVAEEELALAGIPQLAPTDARQLADRCRQQVAAVAGFLTVAATLRKQMLQPPWARAGQAEPDERLYWWRWSSPASDLTARLTISPRSQPDEQVWLEFLDAGQRRATDLAGQTVTLHGVGSTIDPTGKALFALAPLLETDQPLLLQVGSEQIEWLFTDTNMQQ